MGGRRVGRDVANSARKEEDCSREKERSLLYMQPGPTWIVSFQAPHLSPFPEVVQKLFLCVEGRLTFLLFVDTG
jgi:hypothetical protein